MLKRTFNYEDYNGKQREETWYFSLDKAELMKMELGTWGGLDQTMKRLMREEAPDKIVDMFDNIILSAVGEKSPDGRKFIKNEEIRTDFKQTPAYSELFFELVTDPAKANAFIKACLPSDVAMAITKKEEEEKAAEAEAHQLTLVDMADAAVK